MSSYQSVFPAAERSAWDALVKKIMNGALPDSLDRRDEDGLLIKALYDITDDEAGVFGALPAGPNAANRSLYGWDITQPINAAHKGERTAITASNEHIMTALRSGANSLSLFIDEESADHFDALLDGVILDAVDIQLCPVNPCGGGGGNIAAKFDQFVAATNAPSSPVARLNVNAGLDPLAGVASTDASIAAGLALVNGDHCCRGIFNLDGWVWHNRGLTAAAEIGVILAGVAAIMRCADADNMDMGKVAQSIVASVALPADSFAGLVKLRALRLGWAGLCAALGFADTPLYIAGMASLRMVSTLDADVNMLRNTTALLGGAMGGADRLGAFGHDAINGESDAARRLTRMTQVMMVEESGLGRAVDPAAGAPFIEQRSDDLAVAGWMVMQEIEAKGGLATALADGMISDLAKHAADQRDAALSAGHSPMVGVSLQPVSGEQINQTLSFGTFMDSDIYGGLRRPAAIIESLRRSSRPLRILIILPDHGDDGGRATMISKREERALRDWLAIAGLQAVTLHNPSDDDIAAAAPDIMIFGTGSNGDGARGFGTARQMQAETILGCDDQIGLLGQILEGEAA
jgi:methylmalonyl-CoA mutase